MSRQKSAEGIIVNARSNARFMAKAQTFHKEEPYGSQENAILTLYGFSWGSWRNQP
jgi:hypothetical protein